MDDSLPRDFAYPEEVPPHRFVAYRLDDHAMPIVPASRTRSWMEHFPTQSPFRCLPLTMANQSGWTLLNPASFVVHWDGGMRTNSSMKIAYLEPYQTKIPPAVSHFGRGVLSWNIPYLFRTPPGWNLLVRGPANHPKEGIYPFEGLVETDWSPMTFTMNWRITTTNKLIAFEKGEPFCMIVPQRRGDLEAFEPEIRDSNTAPDADNTKRWAISRRDFINTHLGDLDEMKNTTWQGTYFRGFTEPDNPDAPTFPDHQLKRDLKPFDSEWTIERRQESHKNIPE